MKERMSLVFKILVVVVSFIGLYLNFKLFTFSGGIVFFTIQSNLLVFIVYLITVILQLTKKLKKTDIYYIIKGMTTMAIGITMIVYQLLISTSGGMSSYENNMLACNIVHLVVPLMVIIDYIVFGTKGKLKRNYPFIWSVILIVYVVFALIYSSMGGTFSGKKYPYFFLNIDELGIIKVLIYCVCIYIFYVGVGFIIQTIDNKLNSKNS